MSREYYKNHAEVQNITFKTLDSFLLLEGWLYKVLSLHVTGLLPLGWECSFLVVCGAMSSISSMTKELDTPNGIKTKG